MFVFLFLLGFIIWLVYFVLLSSAIKKKSPKVKSRAIITGIAFVVGIIGFVGVGLQPSDHSKIAVSDEAEKVSAATNSENDVKSEALYYNSEVTPEKFLERYNSAIKAHDNTNYMIDKFIIEKGDKGTSMKYVFNKDLAIAGALNKDGTIKEIIMIGKGDLRNETGVGIMTVIGSMILATIENPNSNDPKPILSDLGLFDSDINLDHFKESLTHNGVTYRMGIDHTTTIVFDILF